MMNSIASIVQFIEGAIDEHRDTERIRYIDTNDSPIKTRIFPSRSEKLMTNFAP